MRVVGNRLVATGGLCAPVPALPAPSNTRFRVLGSRLTSVRVPRWKQMERALTAASELTTTYDLLYGSPGDRFFKEQALKAGFKNVARDAWPCEEPAADVTGAAFVDGDYVVFVSGDKVVGVHVGDGWARVQVATDERAQIPEVFSAFRSKYPAAYLTLDADMRVPITFWSNSKFGPQSRLRKIDSAEWDSITGNYAAEVREQLTEMMSWQDGPPTDGQLMLWQGPPGTGKSWALRALASQWAGWAEFHYITDPDSFFVDDPSYMVDVLLADSYDVIDEPSGDVYAEQRDSKWRVLILEDTGELLSATAKEKYGQGLSRLLNVVDGMIGQGLRVLALVTTNDELGDLHPAVTRPGRCAAQIEFGPLSDVEASEWTGQDATGGTLAELYAKYGKAAPAFAADENPDVVEEIRQVAESHKPDGGYGETSWNPETKTVFWVCADWTSLEEHNAAEDAFLAIDGVEHFEHEAEAYPMEGNGWEIVYPDGMTASGSTLAREERTAAILALQQPVPAPGITREELAELLAEERTATFAEAREIMERTMKASVPDPMHLLASAIEVMGKQQAPPVHFHNNLPDVKVDLKPQDLTIDVAPAQIDVHMPEQTPVVIPAPVVEVTVEQPKPMVAVPIRDPDTGQIIRVEHQAVEA